MTVKCEGKFHFPQDSSELEKENENTLHIIHGQMRREPEEHYCKCNAEDCECCYMVGTHSVCSMTKVVTLVDNGNELALQGRVTINNGSVVTCSIKFKEIPKMCYHYDKLEVCFDLKHEEVEDNKLKICGHIWTRYSTAVLMNVDLFCKVFEVKQAMQNVREQESQEGNGDITHFDVKKFSSQYFGQFALQ